MEDVMKKRILMGILVVAAAAGLIVSISGCRWVLSLAPPRGYVVDALTGDPIANATVYLNGRTQIVPPDATNKNQDYAAEIADAQYTTTTNDDGYYIFDDFERGSFILTASFTGYGFTQQIVDIGGTAQYLPNIAAVPDDGNLRIITMWNPDFKDVDVYLTCYVDYDTDGGSPAAFSDNYQIDLSNDFTPESTNIAQRQTVYYLNRTTTPDDVVTLDEDNFGDTAAGQIPGGPETLTIEYIPGATNGAGTVTSISSADTEWSGLAAGNYYWAGVMEFYVDAYHRTVSDSPTPDDSQLSTASGENAADVKTFVMLGTTQLGYYELPSFTDISSASMLRINTFLKDDSSYTNVFQIVPDIRIMPDKETTAFRSLVGTTGGPIVAEVPGRN
jgi:hypothetical protein